MRLGGCKTRFTRQRVRRRGLFFFEDDAVGTEFLDDIVDHAVDVARRTGRAVDFGNIEVLVEAHVERNLVELHNFGQHDLHDDQIHECQARGIPSSWYWRG